MMDLLSIVKGWERKACSWDARIGRCTDLEAREAVDTLPVFQVTTPRPCANLDLGVEVPQYFVAVLRDGRRFLVDTEGYEYARYIVRLP